MVGIPVGLFFAWRHRLRRPLLPLVVVAAMTVVFMIGPLFGLPLISRYVRTPAVFLALFYGLAVCGWLLLAPGTERTRWKWAGIATAALSIAFLPWHVGMLDDAARHARLARAAVRRPARDRARAGGASAPWRAAAGRSPAPTTA